MVLVGSIYRQRYHRHQIHCQLTQVFMSVHRSWSMVFSVKYIDDVPTYHLLTTPCTIPLLLLILTFVMIVSDVSHLTT